MKCKPPFILYFNNNSSKSKIKEKYGNNINSIFSRIPVSVLRKNPEIEKIVNPEQKVIYDMIRDDKKPKMIEITGVMRDSQEKIINNLNSFREMLYDFNQEGDELLENFSEVQEENNKFGKDYKNIQKEKNKFSTGTYLDHDYLIKIANKYAKRGIKVPKISSEKSVFSGSPLILGGSELEDFIVYNLGERKKGDIYLKKVENLVRRKEAGNYVMNDAERKRMEIIEKNEKPKGYIRPDILIPKLKNDIITCRDAIDNVKILDKFLEYKENKDINNKYNDILNISKSPRMYRNRSFNINNNESINKDYEKNKKIIIKKNLSFINKFNNNNRKNSSISRINNKISNISTGAYLSPKVTSENSRIFSSKLANKMNINSAISRNKSNSLKFTPLPSPIYRNDNSNRINFSILNDLYSGKRRNNSSYHEESTNNNNNLSNNKNNSINTSKENIIKNIINERIFSVNDINKVKKRHLTFLKKNSIKFKLDKRISFSKHSAINLDIFDSFKKDINNNNNISKEEISEENELNILNNELEGKNEEGKEGVENEEGESRKNLNINILDNNFDKVSPKIKDIDNKEKEILKNENIKFNSDLNINESKKKEEEKYIKTEKIFNSILSGYQSRRFKIEIDDFLKSRGYDISKKILNKDAYINLIKMRKKMSERNYLLEEYYIRSGNVAKKFLSPKQREMLDKNDLCLQKIEENEYRFKKILLEKNIDKDIDDYD